MSNTGFKLGDKHYEVDVNVYSIDQVRKLCDVDLLACFENEGAVLSDLSRDHIKLVNVLFVLCEDDCKRHETSDADFGRSFKTGEQLNEAVDCFINALLAFFPKHQRDPLQKLMQYSREAEAEMANKMSLMADDPRLKSLVRSQVEKLDEQFTNALESLESDLRAKEPSVN